MHMTDMRYALRTFSRTPGFTLIAVLTLALGIGATTAMFSVVNAVLLRPLPYADPDRLVTTRGSLADLRDFNGSNRSYEGMAFWASNLYNLRTNTDSQQVRAGQITRELLPLLGVQPLLGRNFTIEDERQDTVILGYGTWQSLFGGDPRVIGQTINLTGNSYTVIGVMPAWFRFPTSDFQLWTPLSPIDTRFPEQAKNRAFRIFSAVARLKPGVTLAQAQQEAVAFSGQLAREFPATNEGFVYAVQPLYDRLVGNARPALRLLLGTVALLLLIACANVANLMLTRTTVRERELAIRAALGAGRGRLLRQLIVESLTLAAAGGTLGVLVTMWGVDLLPAVLEARLPRADGIRIDAGVLWFSAGATMMTGIIFGLMPALQAARGNPGSLKDAGRGVAGAARGRRLRRTIGALEVALAVVVLVGAGLLVRSFLILRASEVGFEPAQMLSFNVQFVSLPTTEARVHAAGAVIDRLAHVPGVDVAGASTGLPSSTPQRATRFAVEGRTLTAEEDTGYFIAATPGYFKALKTPILQGRAIDDRDRTGGEAVVVINRTLAMQLFPNGDAVGHRLKIVNPEQSPDWRTIVGVVGNIKYQRLDEDAPQTIYTPFAQTPFMWLYVMVRTNVAANSMMPTLRSAVTAVEPSLTAANIRPMTDIVDQSFAEPRFTMLLVSAFAVLALVLSSIGIYGVIAYSVAQRTQEIGVRMALGARRLDVMQLVVGEGIAIAAVGVSVGLAGAFALSRLMRTMLVGVSPHDPLTFVSGAVILLTIAVAASCVPALRAARVEPVTALRAE
jgi:putative ABC transport system permease protein